MMPASDVFRRCILTPAQRYLRHYVRNTLLDLAGQEDEDEDEDEDEEDGEEGEEGRERITRWGKHIPI